MRAPALTGGGVSRPSRQVGSRVGGRAKRGNADEATYALEQQRREARGKRYRLRIRLQALGSQLREQEGIEPPSKSVQCCAQTLVTAAGFGQAALMLGADGVAGLTGVKTCSSVSACPVCSARIRAQRTREVEAAGVSWLTGRWNTEGRAGYLGFGTLTLPHDTGDPLDGLLDAVRGAWKYVQQDKAFRALRKAYGLRFVRSVEFTYTRAEQGGSGWHPHLHVLWFSEVELTATRLAALDAAVRSPWQAYIVRAGWRKPTQMDLQAVEGRTGREGLLRYLTKVQDGYEQGSPALEMTRGDLKRARKLSRTPFEIAEGAADGSGRDVRLWLEYVTATKGKRIIEPSRGLYRDLNVREVADELAPDVTPDARPLAFFDAPAYALVVRYRAAARLLDLAETHHRPADAVAAYVRALERRAAWESRQ